MAKKLLLADDSVTIQKVVGISFASEDVVLITVDNGDDAVAKAREARPDVVLADVIMPGMNGYEVCEAIKSDPSLRHIPVLLLTGTFEAFDEERAQRCGAAGHVAKPFEAQALVERVLDLFAQAPPPPPAPVAAPETPTAPESTTAPQAPPMAAGEPNPAAGDSFDFFDDDLGQIAQPASGTPSGAPTNPAQLGSSGDAFAFGADDLGAPEADTGFRPARPAATPTPVPIDAPPDRTVAILPEDGDDPLAQALAAAPGGPPAAHDLGDDLMSTAFGGPGGGPAAPEDDVFDFDIGGSTAERVHAAAQSAEDDDLAHATVLDPMGASGFDVSSSDLGDPLAAGPGATGPAAQAPAPPAQPPSGPARPLGVVSDPFDFDASDPLAASMPAEPPAAPPVAPARPQAPPPMPPPVPPAMPPPARSVEPDLAPAELDDGDALFAIGEEEPLRPESLEPAAELGESALEHLSGPGDAGSDAPRAASHDPAALAGVALAEITPRLRAELHDTLEKMAWESFGDLADQIVRQAVERVEQIAWEAVPQLAETLIREEIRRLKGEAED
jgi:CheY-like chemotaxis protein